MRKNRPELFSITEKVLDFARRAGATAAEVAVGLALIVAIYRRRQTTHVEDLRSLKF